MQILSKSQAEMREFTLCYTNPKYKYCIANFQTNMFCKQIFDVSHWYTLA